MTKHWILLVSLASVTAAASAAPLTFDFKDPKGVNNVAFKVDAPLEAVNGAASGVSGSVVYDPENPGATHGRIEVTSASLMVPNPMQQQHMHGDQWLDVARYPLITFEARELKNVKSQGAVTSADAVGTFTLKGISKEMTIPVKLTYLPGKLGERVPHQEGDLLVIRSQFSVKRSDFNIQPGKSEDKVSDEIDLTLAVAGAAPKSP